MALYREYDDLDAALRARKGDGNSANWIDVALTVNVIVTLAIALGLYVLGAMAQVGLF